VFFEARGGRQKGLVDHVCPADFSYLATDGKVPLTITTLALHLLRGARALAAFVSRCGDIVHPGWWQPRSFS
jgi:hypothetical protein